MNKLGWLGALALLFACTPADEETQLKQRYISNGKRVYQLHCARCHGNNGEGLAQLYPPLAGADWLRDSANVTQAICMVRYGRADSLQVNGRWYNLPMPANTELLPQDMAMVLTYVTNSWGNQGRLITQQEVEATLRNCQATGQ